MLCGFGFVLGSRVLRKFCLHDVAENASLQAIFNDIAGGINDCGDGFLLSVELYGRRISCEVGNSMNSPEIEFLTVPLSTLVGSASQFGKWFRFKLFDIETTATSKNAFAVLLAAANKKQLPDKILHPRNKHHELNNAIIDWIEDQKLGWTAESLPQGQNFVCTLRDVMWEVSTFIQIHVLACFFFNIYRHCLFFLEFS